MPERDNSQWCRGLRLEDAAAYCGISPGLLTSLGPPPIRIGKRRRIWLRDALDAWLDLAAGKAPASGGADFWDK